MPDAALDVLQVITSTHRRGAETYAVALGRALAARPETARVRTVALAGAPPPALDVPALAARPRAPAAVARLRTESRRTGVVVAHGSATLPAAALATLGGPPFVYRVIGDPTVWAPSGLRRARVGWLLRRAAAVAVYFPAAAEALTAHHGLPPERVHVLAKGIDLAEWPAVDATRRQTARAELGLADGPVLAWLGALSPEKRPGLALAVAEAMPDATLLLAGTGPLAGELASQAARLGARVRLLGAVDDPRPVVAAADVVLLTSRTEGVPGVALEAQASGVPVVAVDVGGVGQVVHDGVTGRLVPPGGGTEALTEGLVEAVHDVLGRAGELGGAGRRHVAEHHRLDVVAERWAALLGGLSAARRLRSA